MIKKILAAAAFGVVAMGAQASTNLLTDGDFESTGQSFAASSYCYAGNVPAPQCNAPSYAINGWSGNNAVYLQSNSGPWGDPSSQAHAGIDLGGVVAGIQSGGSLVSAFTFTAGDAYTLSWSDAGRNNWGGDQTYTVSAGDTSIGSFTTLGNGWSTHSFTFVATGADALVFQGLATNDSTSFIDNVSVTAVPEPAALLMMAVGTLGLLAWRRRARA
jgi:hypothetical protein